MNTSSIHRVRYVLVAAVAIVLIGATYLAGSVPLRAPKAEAGTLDNLKGWAWSSTIGWISLNSVDCDKDTANGYVDVVCGGDDTSTPVVNYGVNIDISGKQSGATGNFSGKAWSKNIGWISFDAGDLGGCPLGGTCVGQVDWSTGKVTGWARALANGGGWDGWISLSGMTSEAIPQPYGLEISGAHPAGFAWGGSVVGWIDFAPVVGGSTLDQPQISTPTCTLTPGYSYPADPNMIWGSCTPTVVCGAPGYPSDGSTYSGVSGVVVGACTVDDVHTGGTTVVTCGTATLVCPITSAPVSTSTKTHWWQF